jgi:hypothetical protein
MNKSKDEMKEAIIHNMCLSSNHAYGAPINENDLFDTCNRKMLYSEMKSIFEKDIYPHMKFRKSK